MKILYSQIKELVPGLKAGPKEVGEALSLTGFMMDSFSEVLCKGAKDYLIGLEIRQNRADCLSVLGLAREVAAYYNLKISMPKVKPVAGKGKQLDIKIEAADYVKRVLAVQIDGITNRESPDWLKEYVAFYGLNSISLLVDLSNYVMLLTGYPSHLIDYKKITGQVSWSLNRNFDQMTTLLGASVKLQKNTELIIRDEKNILALAGIVGGTEAAIGMETTSIIAEVAVYNRSIVRKNSRSLSITTEASHRLEKEIDSTSSYYALQLLVFLIIKYAGGDVSSGLFDYYPKEHLSPIIKFDTSLPGKFSGVEISEKNALKILKNLDFSIAKKPGSFFVSPPIYRMDVSIAEDLVEEVIRMHGYNKIPSNEIPKLEIVQEITPKNIILTEKIRDILAALGFDEILSWPLTKTGDNEQVNYLDWNMVAAQNSFNDAYPNLRQSITVGLLNQLNEYIKKKVDFINIFEIGKVFGEKNGEYMEHEALGIISTSNVEAIAEFKNKTESLLRLIGLGDIKYFEAAAKPKIANASSCWEIYASGENIGIFYKLIPQEAKLNVYSAEINITKITGLLLKIQNNPVVEITQKLITLDANIELSAKESIYKYLDKLEKKLNKNHIWSVNVADTYPLGEKVRYTLRVTYQELSDQDAKKIHLKIFELK
ncbi:MAG: phenylalanine--tRNA ligase subunit beta [bacterium]|nr:phenylalanine--tRNA ligase subunit beta [bacterium]